MITLPYDPILTWIRNRIVKNKNCIIIINGSTGSGKTYAGLTLCCKNARMFGTNFSLKTNMAFNFADLLKKTMLPENNKPGTCFLFEEVGAVGSGSAARSWQSQANQFFFSFMQTARHRNQILVLTCPHFSFLERGARTLVHLQCEMQSIDFRKRLSYLRPYRVQVNPRTGQFYFKYIRVQYKGVRIKVTRWTAELPPKEIIKEYELLKGKFTSELNKMIIEKSEEKKEKKKQDNKQNKLKEAQLKVHLDQGLSHTKIAAMYGLSTKTIQRMRRSIEKSMHRQSKKGKNGHNKS